ncbi:aminodeoxychorismate lyase [Bacillus sp. C1]
MLIYVNGTYVEANKAKISPYDHGYLYGLGVFETFRIYDGHPFLLDDHYERLMDALSMLQIKWTMTKDDVCYILQELLLRNKLNHAYVRLNVSAGIDEIGLQTEVYEEPSVIVFIKPLAAPSVVVEKEGVILRQVRNTPEGAFRLKSHHYLNNILGKREIGNVVSKEGIFFTKSGHVAEGIVSNLFFVKGRVLYTPSLETGILNGITRAFIIKIAEVLNMQVEEGFFTKDELLSADEVFVTNSVQEIVPLRQIEEKDFLGKEGEVTKNLMRVYEMHREKLWSRNELWRGDVQGEVEL